MERKTVEVPKIEPKVPPRAPVTALAYSDEAQLLAVGRYGRVEINYNPALPMPDGIPLPLSTVALTLSYKEGK